MGRITIEKYLEGRCVEKMSFPVAPLRLLTKLLPRKAKVQLIELGLDLEAILHESTASECWIDIEENKVPKRIRVVRQPQLTY